MNSETCNGPPQSTLSRALWAVAVKALVEVFVYRDIEVVYRRIRGVSSFNVQFPDPGVRRYPGDCYAEDWESPCY